MTHDLLREALPMLTSIRDVQTVMTDRLPEPIHSYRAQTLYLELMLETKRLVQRDGEDPMKSEVGENLGLSEWQRRIGRLVEQGLLAEYRSHAEESGKRCKRLTITSQGDEVLLQVQRAYDEVLEDVAERLEAGAAAVERGSS